MFSFCLASFPLTGSLPAEADGTVSNNLLNEQSSRGSERVLGTPGGSVKFRRTIRASGAVLLSSQQSQASAAIIFTTSQVREVPSSSRPDGPFHTDTTSSHNPATILSAASHTLRLLCKDAAQGCNKIHTKVIFHKEKKLRNNCSSNAQQASDSWLPARGALVMCS